MEKESKKILVKFFGVFLLVVSVVLLLRQDKNYVLLGLVVFAIALVVLINYNLRKEDYCSSHPEKCSGIKEDNAENKEKVKKKK